MKQEVGEEKELKVEYLLVDLASFSSVKDFVKTFREKNLPLDILINNAAICGVPFSKCHPCVHVSLYTVIIEVLPLAAKTSDGFDLQFQVNTGSIKLIIMSVKRRSFDYLINIS